MTVLKGAFGEPVREDGRTDITSSAPQPDFAALLRHEWRRVAFAALAGAAVMLLFVLVRPRRYEAHGIFLPQTRRSAPSAITGLAAQLGVNMSTDGAASPAFFAELLTGDELLGRAVDSKIAVGSDSSRTLAEQLGATGATDEERREDAIRRLRHAVDVAVNLKSGTVRLSVRLARPDLAANTVTRLLAILNDMNVESRQSSGTAEHRFATDRAAAAHAALDTSEDALRVFLQRNRRYDTAPELVLEYQRLEREVTRHESLLTMLLQMVEQARLDQVRDTPMLSVVERPRAPARPDRSGDLMLVVMGGAVGAVLSMGFVIRKSASQSVFQQERL
jgi:uncharacterized protein involved in exopolysaccharide biosynthesis